MIRLTNRKFDTHPIVAHCPGPLHDGWRYFQEAVLAAAAGPCRCDDLTIITWNSGPRPEKPCGAFEHSLQKLGISPVVLGNGADKWQNIDKLRITADALQHVTTPLVMAADSSDVLIVDDPSLLAQRFRQHFHCDLLFNATGARCWPELPEFVSFESSLPWAAAARGCHWFNSGVWIGHTEFCRRYFAAAAEERPVAGFEWSDQAVLKRIWPQWYPRVQIDYLSILFQWFNEDRAVLSIERPLARRQRQLIDLLRPLGAPLRGVEVGVFDGFTSDALLRELPGLQLWMIDPWTPYEGKSQLGELDQAAFDQARRRAAWWTSHSAQRRFLLQKPSPQAASSFANATLDFAFIDGNHLYEHVRDDVAGWWPKIRSGGILCGHDYGINRDAENLWGVRRAVDEFAAKTERQLMLGDDGVWWMHK